MSLSIRRRLLNWLSPILFLTALVAALMTRSNVQKEIDELFDKVLRTVAYSMTKSAASIQDFPIPKSLAPKLPDLDLISLIWSPEGHLRYRSHPFRGRETFGAQEKPEILQGQTSGQNAANTGYQSPSYGR
ncbi:MAG: hypothetical protein ACRERV_00765 [Methylococcales bacterium]